MSNNACNNDNFTLHPIPRDNEEIELLKYLSRGKYIYKLTLYNKDITIQGGHEV